MLGALNFCTMPRIPKKQIVEHYNTNIAILSGAGRAEKSFYKPNQYIENQSEWKALAFGAVSMDYAGCEIIATYNALLSLGEEMAEKEMAGLISAYEREGAVLHGRWGVAPAALYHYFQNQGYHVGMTTSLEIDEMNAVGEKYDTTIISSFNNRDKVTGGIHTVNISKDEKGYRCHNGYTWGQREDGTRGYAAGGPENSLGEAVMRLSGGRAKPVCIIGIARKDESD